MKFSATRDIRSAGTRIEGFISDFNTIGAHESTKGVLTQMIFYEIAARVADQFAPLINKAIETVVKDLESEREKAVKETTQ